MCMQFTLDKIPSKIVFFTTSLLLLYIPCRKATNSAGPGARQSTTDSAQLVDQIRWLLKPCILAASTVHIMPTGSNIHQLKYAPTVRELK